MLIGICDWGIGGAGVYRLLRKHTSADVIYFSDTGYTPYGKVPEEELRARLERVFRYLRSAGARYIIVACNAASTVLTGTEKDITGVIEHAIELVLEHQPPTLGVVGGTRTIESGLYKNMLEKKGIEVKQRVAQPLSAKIETGDIDSEALHQDIKEIFTPIQEVSHILLACTHYPLISAQISQHIPRPLLLDPAEKICEWILQHWELPDGNNSISWITTGDPGQMEFVLKKAYGIDAGIIKKIEL